MVEESIEVEFALTKHDYLIVAKMNRSQTGIPWLLRLAVLILIGMAVVEAFLGDWTLVLLAVMGLTLLAVTPLIIVRIIVRLSYNRDIYAGAHVKMWIDTNELRTESVIGSSTIRHLDKVVESQHGILCHLGASPYLFIPRRAFTDDEQFRLAVERLRQLTLPIQY
jgi:hypothetical protein